MRLPVAAAGSRHRHFPYRRDTGKGAKVQRDASEVGAEEEGGAGDTAEYDPYPGEQAVGC